MFVEQGINDKWEKIDNTSVLIGEGTPNTIAMWVGGTTPSTTLNDSIITELNNVISIAGDLSTQGLEVNKYLRDGDGNDGIDGQVLTSTTVNGDKEVVWTTPTTGTVTGSGTGQVLSKFSGTGTGQTVLEDSLVSETSSLNFNVTATAVSSTATILTFTDTTNNPTNITVGGTLTVDVTSVGGPGIVVINVTNVNNQVITATAPSPGYVGYVRNALDGSYSNIPTVYNSVSAGISIAGELDMSTNKITNVVDPTDAQDAATKSYVDSATVSGSGTIGTLPVFTGTDVLGDSNYKQNVSGDTVDILTKTVTDASAYTINTNIGKLTRQGVFPGAGALTSNVTIGAQYTYGDVDIAMIAKGFGREGRIWTNSATTIAELDRMLAEYSALGTNMPGVLELKIAEEELPPFMPFVSSGAETQQAW